MAPIILFTWRQFQKYGKLPTEQDFINRIHEFEAERDKVFEVICGLNSNEIKILKRAKSVRESLEKLRKTKPIL